MGHGPKPFLGKGWRQCVADVEHLDVEHLAVLLAEIGECVRRAYRADDAVAAPE